VADLAVRNARVVTEEGVFLGGIAVQEGMIVALGTNESLPSAETVVDAERNYLLPGGVDPHVHIRYPGGPHRETFSTGTAAAAAGGITTIIEHPISAPPPFSKEILLNRVAAVTEQALVDVAFFGAAGYDKAASIGELASAGIVAYKTFLQAAPEGRENEFIGLTMKDSHELYAGLRAVAPTGLPLAAHAEDNDLVSGLVQEFRAAGKVSPLDHARTRPPVTEVLSVERLIRLARETGATLYLVHISTPEAVMLADQARKAGQRIFIETCPQYLYLSEEALIQHGPYAKCNPPLRTRAEVDAMWRFVQDGTVDTIGSDHSPFTAEEKEKGLENIFNAPSGFPGLETRLPLMLTAIKEGRISLAQAVNLLSTNPSRIFGLYPRKGTIKIGADADLALVNLDEPFTLHHSNMLTKSRDASRVYDGWKLYGRVLKTFVRGKLVFDEGRIVAEPGWGQWVTPGE
jgi:allantoinase